MYAMRAWSVRHIRWLRPIYLAIEFVLVKSHPLLNRIGYARLERPVVVVENAVKGFLFDSRSCGQCILGFTGMSCPMNCPKAMRNGPCGGVRPDGKCEVKPQMTCVWVLAWEGSKRLSIGNQLIQVVQPPLDNRLQGSSAWLREVRLLAQDKLRIKIST